MKAQVTVTDFINSPAVYLERVADGIINITRDGQTIAVLTPPGVTPIADSLLGILEGSDVSNSNDIKTLRRVSFRISAANLFHKHLRGVITRKLLFNLRCVRLGSPLYHLEI